MEIKVQTDGKELLIKKTEYTMIDVRKKLYKTYRPRLICDDFNK